MSPLCRRMGRCVGESVCVGVCFVTWSRRRRHSCAPISTTCEKPHIAALNRFFCCGILWWQRLYYVPAIRRNTVYGNQDAFTQTPSKDGNSCWCCCYCDRSKSSDKLTQRNFCFVEICWGDVLSLRSRIKWLMCLKISISSEKTFGKVGFQFLFWFRNIGKLRNVRSTGDQRLIVCVRVPGSIDSVASYIVCCVVILLIQRMVISYI